MAHINTLNFRPHACVHANSVMMVLQVKNVLEYILVSLTPISVYLDCFYFVITFSQASAPNSYVL